MHIDKSLMRSPNLHEIYERHLPFSLLMVVVPVLLLLLDARTTLGVTRAHVHLEKIVELHRPIHICKENYYSG